jgi:hypothetical protein
MSLHEGGRQTSERVDSFATLTERPDTINKVDLAPLKIRALCQRLCNTIEHCHWAEPRITTSQCPSLHPPTAVTTNLQRLAGNANRVAFLQVITLIIMHLHSKLMTNPSLSSYHRHLFMDISSCLQHNTSVGEAKTVG